ncbi:methylcytosine dioxygenase TET-like isoform X2 [Ornithodoros turicata]|uniref:methylcytosine dioxygenase TET-like isoform X2 n=1 Tax=Ornithodoros turicata TaxID=34597 RepID=UPI003139AE0C
MRAWIPTDTTAAYGTRGISDNRRGLFRPDTGSPLCTNSFRLAGGCTPFARTPASRDVRSLTMSERQPGALHGGCSPFEGPPSHHPSPTGPGPGPLLGQDGGWMVGGGPPPPYPLLSGHSPSEFPFGPHSGHPPSNGPAHGFGPPSFDPMAQFGKVPPGFPPSSSFPFAAPFSNTNFKEQPTEDSSQSNGKDEGLSARLIDKSESSSGPSPPSREGTPAGNVGYRPWEQEGYEGGRPPSAPPSKDRPFSNGGDKGPPSSPGMQSQDSSQSSERMPTPVDKMAAQNPAAHFGSPMQHHPFADFPPHPSAVFQGFPEAKRSSSPGEPSFQVPSVSSTTTRCHTLMPMVPPQEPSPTPTPTGPPGGWHGGEHLGPPSNGVAPHHHHHHHHHPNHPAPMMPHHHQGVVGGGNAVASGDEKGTKKKRKRCGECPGCLKKDNCGECGPCRSVRSHQICKMRKCDQLKTKKEKERYEKMMHQMHERRRGTPDENKNMQQVGGFGPPNEYHLAQGHKNMQGPPTNQMYEMAPHFGGFPPPQHHPQQGMGGGPPFNGHLQQPPQQESRQSEDASMDFGSQQARHQMMNNRLKTLIQTRQSQKEQGPFHGLENTLGPSLGGNFAHPQPPQASDAPSDPSIGHQPFRPAQPDGVVRGFPPPPHNGGGNTAPPSSNNELPQDVWRDVSPSSARSQSRGGGHELQEFTKNNGSSSQSSNNHSEAEFSQSEDQSREDEFNENAPSAAGMQQAAAAGNGPLNGMIQYGAFYAGSPTEGKVEASRLKETGKEMRTEASTDGQGNVSYQFTSAPCSSLTTTTTTSTVTALKNCSAPVPATRPPDTGNSLQQHQQGQVPPCSDVENNNNNNEEPTETATHTQQQPFLSNTTTSMNTYTSIISTYNSFAATSAPSYFEHHPHGGTSQPKFIGQEAAAAARTGGDVSDVDGGRIAVGEFRGLEFGLVPLQGGPDGGPLLPPSPKTSKAYGNMPYQGSFPPVEGPFQPYGGVLPGMSSAPPFSLPPMPAGGSPFAPVNLPGVDPWWERLERLRNNTKAEAPNCDCYGNEESPPMDKAPYYTHLGSGPSVSSVRDMLEKRLNERGPALRLEKVLYTGKEGKTSQGCPLAKWIIRRSGPSEKVLAVLRHRLGHRCSSAYIVVAIVAWEGVDNNMADDLYRTVVYKTVQFGLPTQRRCGTNEQRTCACQGSDPDTCGASFSFGCSWSMYYNGCKYARSKAVRKFKLSEQPEEQELEDKLQVLATEMAPLYLKVAPESFRNQVEFESEGLSCRLGLKRGRPFSGVTACLDFCAHAHKDLHNMNNGCTVVVTLTKYRQNEKPDDEQLHVLPLYILDPTDENGKKDGIDEKVRNGALEILKKYPTKARVRRVPLGPCKKRGRKEKATEEGLQSQCQPMSGELQADEGYSSQTMPSPVFSPGADMPQMRKSPFEERYRKGAMSMKQVNDFPSPKLDQARHFFPSQGHQQDRNHVVTPDSNNIMPGRVKDEHSMQTACQYQQNKEYNYMCSTPAGPQSHYTCPESQHMDIETQRHETTNVHIKSEFSEVETCIQSGTSLEMRKDMTVEDVRRRMPQDLPLREQHPIKQEIVNSYGSGHNHCPPHHYNNHFTNHRVQQNRQPTYNHVPQSPQEIGALDTPPDDHTVFGSYHVQGNHLYSASPGYHPHTTNQNFEQSHGIDHLQNLASVSNHHLQNLTQQGEGSGLCSPYGSPTQRHPYHPALNNYAYRHPSTPPPRDSMPPPSPLHMKPASPHVLMRSPTQRYSPVPYPRSGGGFFSPHHEAYSPHPSPPVTPMTPPTTPRSADLHHTPGSPMHMREPYYPANPNTYSSTQMSTGYHPAASRCHSVGWQAQQDYAVPHAYYQRRPPYFPAPPTPPNYFASHQCHPLHLPSSGVTPPPHRACLPSPETAKPSSTLPPFKNAFLPPQSAPNGFERHTQSFHSALEQAQQRMQWPTSPFYPGHQVPHNRPVSQERSAAVQHRVPQLSFSPMEAISPIEQEDIYEVDSDNESAFQDDEVGGVAIALTHGSVLFECAKHELHATTALKRPNRKDPTRISLVFYQHKNLNFRNHGEEEWEKKMEVRRLERANGERPSKKKAKFSDARLDEGGLLPSVHVDDAGQMWTPSPHVPLPSMFAMNPY